VIVVSDTSPITNLAAVGQLIESKHRGLIQEVKPVVDNLMNQGFHIKQDLYQRVFRAAGE